MPRHRIPGFRVAFLTADDLTGYVTDDHLAASALRDRGHDVRFVSWRDGSTDWSRFDGVVIRTTWDYHREPARFLAHLERIDRVTWLANPLDLVRWNHRKTYLRDLAARGVAVPPTLWLDRLRPGGLGRLFDRLDSDPIVLKPVIGASGEDTFRITGSEAAGREAVMLRILGDRAVMAQPFIESVLDPGEWGVVYIGGQRSHAVIKTAAPGEYRVQEEHGGDVRAAEPEAALLETADRAVRWIDPAPLYARVDLLRDAGGGWLVTELELIEPALYLRTMHGAAARFADAVESWLVAPAAAAGER